jgi:SagB-type dehydrogenase family enzyme
MNTLTKLIKGKVGALRPTSTEGTAQPRIELPPPRLEVDFGLMKALQERCSRREFRADPLPAAVLSDLLWAAAGVNRKGGGRTVPAAVNAHAVAVYAALPEGVYRYDPKHHVLDLASAVDLRPVTGYQDFVDNAPLDLIYVADQHVTALMPSSQREPFTWVEVGAVAQNVYLYCAAYGLACVLRAWLDREAVAQALQLTPHQQVLLSQTVGYPKG